MRVVLGFVLALLVAPAFGETLVERGAYLVNSVMVCHNCHTPRGPDGFDLSRALHPFLDAFDEIVVSGREGVTKPDARIYQLLFERSGRAPGELVFVDDVARNIAAAERLQDEFGSSKFTALYLSQAREFLLGPPDEDWDGTIVLESK